MHSIKNEDVEHFKDIVIYPDFSSSGIWCSCGLGTGDPDQLGTIPKNLIELVEIWNHYWELCIENYDKINVENCQKNFNAVGRILAKDISNFLPCEFIEDRAIIKDYNRMSGMKPDNESCSLGYKFREG